MESIKKTIWVCKISIIFVAFLLLFAVKNYGQGLNKVTLSNSFLSQSHFEKSNWGYSSSFENSPDIVNIVIKAIASSSDDAEEEASNGDMSLTSGDLELINDVVDQVVGLRFIDLGIPQCATINSAYIQFTAKNTTIDACNLTIYGEGSDNAQTFTNADFNISSRPKTTASTNWVPQPWQSPGASGVDERTTDLTQIIQEIVERPGFTPNSSIAIIIEGTGLRRAYAYDENVILAATIRIDYNPDVPDGDGDGVCDANDLCPGGPEPGTPCDDNLSTTYDDAIDANCNCVGIPYDCPNLEMNIGDNCDDGNPETSNDTITSNCVCLGSYDCPILELNIGDPCDDGNPNTSNDMVSVNCECSGSYDCPTFPANIGDPCDDGESGTSNDIIDSNCNCVGIWDCPTLNLGIGYPCDDGNPNTSSDIVDADCNCEGLPFICLKVASSTDDAEEFPSGDMKLTSNDLEMVIDADSIQKIGIRFQNIAIPQCAVITKATIQFTAKNTNGNDGPCDLTIYGENSDNAATFSNGDFNISNRLKTDTSANWIPDVWVGDASGPAQKSVDIAHIIQEIVNREGFVSGNSIAIIIEGTGLRRAYSFNNSPTTAPEICIEFDPNIPDSDDDGTCDANDLCPGGLEPGTPCDDGNPNTPNDFIDENCDCVGGFDCPDLMVDFGDTCDDGISGTYNDTIDSTCTCVGIWECPDYPGGPVGYGYPCDDLDPNTLYDAIDSTCNCVGVPFILVGVSEQDDDAEESPSGDMNLTSNDLEMAVDDSTQTIGIRFKNLQIPHCAVINAAYIQFTAKNSTLIDPCTLQIFGEDTDDAEIFINEDFNISNRAKTDAMAVWSPEEWSSNDAGTAQQTPDISPIIQEIINRTGFTDSSSMAFIIEGIGMRRAYSYDAGDSIAPKLYIEYLDIFPDDDNDGTCNANDQCPGLPEPGTPCDDLIMETYDDVYNLNCECVGIPYDCEILLANIGDSCNDGDPNTPNDFIDSNCECIGGFDCPDLMLDFGDLCDDGISGTYDDMIDSTCNCVGIWECPDIMAGFNDPCDDGDPSTLDDTINNQCECEGSPTVYSPISSSSDDAEEKETGQVNLTSSDLELVYEGNFQTVGLRFTNLNIPHKARIDTAFIQFTTDEIVDPNPSNLTIYGQASDDAQTFIDVNGDVSNRPKTSAMVDWTPENWLVVNEAGTIQQTENLKTIVKEIVNRPGFNTNSSIAFIIEGTGTRTATAYDGDPEKAPVLYVRYDLPLAANNIPFSKKEQLLVYPVPTTENLNISFTTNAAAQVPIQIIDLNGRVLFTDSRSVIQGKNDILIEHLTLQNGIYFVQLYFDNSIHTAKFTIVK